MKNVAINSEFVTLGQFLKMVDAIDSGGQAKFFLMENDITVNGTKEDRRGRKLYNGDIVDITSFGQFKIVEE